MTQGVTRVKICGVTSREDAELAIEAGADALGFNVWQLSKRHVDLDEAGWIADLAPYVARIAIAVNPSQEEAEALAALPFIDGVQFHGEESPDFCRHFSRLGARFFKAIPVRDERSFDQATGYGTRSLVLDAHAPGEFGGTGRKINWHLAAQFVREHPELRVVLSGGLTPANVAEAVRVVKPYAVDVASGVEKAPGEKDPRLLKEFVAAVRFAI